MNFFQLFRMARLFLVAFLFVGMMIFGLIFGTISLILNEVGFYRRYGKDWVREYEKYNGPVEKTNFKIGLGVFGMVAICLLAWWAYKNIDPYRSKKRKRRRGGRGRMTV
jgi:formate hydrogenlyase subunit 3/multisubunit Na+/H+ antiporter MnhD subunit